MTKQKLKQDLKDFGKLAVMLGVPSLACFGFLKGCIYWDRNIQPKYEKYLDEQRLYNRQSDDNNYKFKGEEKLK